MLQESAAALNVRGEEFKPVGKACDVADLLLPLSVWYMSNIERPQGRPMAPWQSKTGFQVFKF